MAVFELLLRIAIAVAVLAGAPLVHAAEERPPRIVRKVVAEESLAPGEAARPAHRLHLTLALLGA